MSTSFAKKERLRNQREIEKCKIDDFCKDHNIKMAHLTEFQIRLNKRIDVYPTNKKYCILNAFGGKWGRYSDLDELIKYLKNV